MDGVKQDVAKTGENSPEIPSDYVQLGWGHGSVSRKARCPNRGAEIKPLKRHKKSVGGGVQTFRLRTEGRNRGTLGGAVGGQ